MNKEIFIHQQSISKCVDNVLDTKLDIKQDIVKDLEGCLSDHSKLQDSFKSIVSKTALTTPYHSLDFIARLENSFLNLGKYGYDGLLCKSFALNYTTDELRHDTDFNKALKTETPSRYFFGINDPAPHSYSYEMNFKARLDNQKALDDIKNTTIKTGNKQKRDLFYQKVKLNNVDLMDSIAYR